MTTTDMPRGVAAGEPQLLLFVDAWRRYCEEQGLPWGEPKLASERGLCVARFDAYRVSLTHWSSRARVANVAEWMTVEADARWVPVALTDDLDMAAALTNVACVLDRRIPW